MATTQSKRKILREREQKLQKLFELGLVNEQVDFDCKVDTHLNKMQCRAKRVGREKRAAQKALLYKGGHRPKQKRDKGGLTGPERELKEERSLKLARRSQAAYREERLKMKMLQRLVCSNADELIKSNTDLLNPGPWKYNMRTKQRVFVEDNAPVQREQVREPVTPELRAAIDRRFKVPTKDLKFSVVRCAPRPASEAEPKSKVETICEMGFTEAEVATMNEATFDAHLKLAQELNEIGPVDACESACVTAPPSVAAVVAEASACNNTTVAATVVVQDTCTAAPSPQPDACSVATDDDSQNCENNSPVAAANQDAPAEEAPARAEVPLLRGLILEQSQVHELVTLLGGIGTSATQQVSVAYHTDSRIIADRGVPVVNSAYEVCRIDCLMCNESLPQVVRRVAQLMKSGEFNYLTWIPLLYWWRYMTVSIFLAWMAGFSTFTVLYWCFVIGFLPLAGFCNLISNTPGLWQRRNLFYVPHLVSTVKRDYANGAPADLATRSVRQRLLSVPNFPLPDNMSVNCLSTCEAIIDMLLRHENLTMPPGWGGWDTLFPEPGGVIPPRDSLWPSVIDHVRSHLRPQADNCARERRCERQRRPEPDPRISAAYHHACSRVTDQYQLIEETRERTRMAATRGSSAPPRNRGRRS